MPDETELNVDDRFDDITAFFEKRLAGKAMRCSVCGGDDLELLNSRPVNPSAPSPSLVYTSPGQIYGNATPTITLICRSCQHLIPFSLYGVLRRIDAEKQDV